MGRQHYCSRRDAGYTDNFHCDLVQLSSISFTKTFPLEEVENEQKIIAFFVKKYLFIYNKTITKFRQLFKLNYTKKRIIKHKMKTLNEN